MLCLTAGFLFSTLSIVFMENGQNGLQPITIDTMLNKNGAILIKRANRPLECI